MWTLALFLGLMAFAALSLLFFGSRVKIDGRGIKMGFRTYTAQDIMRHSFLVTVRHKSPAEYFAKLNIWLPWLAAPPSRKPKWFVELEVFDSTGKYIRKHSMPRASEGAAKKLEMELNEALAAK